MDWLNKQLLNYQSNYSAEIDFKHRMLNLIKTLGLLAFTRKSSEAHFTASAWIVNPNNHKVLLLHHKKLNKWLQAGGHADSNTDLEQVSRKEAEEETALKNLKLAQDGIFDLDIHVIPTYQDIPAHEHFDVRFIYFYDQSEQININSESNDFVWVNLKEIAQLSKEVSILRMVEKTKNILDVK